MKQFIALIVLSVTVAGCSGGGGGGGSSDDDKKSPDKQGSEVETEADPLWGKNYFAFADLGTEIHVNYFWLKKPNSVTLLSGVFNENTGEMKFQAWVGTYKRDKTKYTLTITGGTCKYESATVYDVVINNDDTLFVKSSDSSSALRYWDDHYWSIPDMPDEAVATLTEDVGCTLFPKVVSAKASSKKEGLAYKPGRKPASVSKVRVLMSER